MKLGYFGDGPWSHKALDRILENPELEVAFIVARYDKADPVLGQYAQRLGVPFYLHPDVNSSEFLGIAGAHCCDIYVSMSFNQILRKQILESVPHGFINCHAGALPFYRGRNILNWALINGESRFGVTVHYVDEGIDTGDIILQRFAEITDSDDYATLLDKAIDLCASILPDALSQIARGEQQRISQSSIHPVGFYCSQRRPGDEWIDWSLPSRNLHNFVRALTTPGPGARTIFNDKDLAVLRSELIVDAPLYYDRPGTVVGRDASGIVVKTGDATVRITKVADVASDGSLVNERTPAFRMGSVLGFDTLAMVAAMRERRSRP
ncbi:methionyl-tRNA formyltransferase [Geomonas nitrogeniifigens]|uniref:Methionyl-tRNA formyltransferase n=1 Tax=Geomonas diazotrophica TaxID=2843197 RepID=A0ABX8JCC9_9BACT|nr:methionyl-tRNA formyltransferase [Geomonas nitrogeniifigens]QWV95973.1 methionyl-tRNA formyltransferase [Geomonas nitrogeniifigens]